MRGCLFWSSSSSWSMSSFSHRRLLLFNSSFYRNSFRLLAPLLLVIYLLFVLPFHSFLKGQSASGGTRSFIPVKHQSNARLPNLLPDEKIIMKSSWRIFLWIIFLLWWQREREKEDEDEVLNGFMLHLGLYRPKQHVIISYSTTKRKTVWRRKRFRLIKFIAGRLCVYQRAWWILFSPSPSSSFITVPPRAGPISLIYLWYEQSCWVKNLEEIFLVLFYQTL